MGGVRGLVEDVGFFGVFAGIDFYFNWEAQKQGEQMVGDYCANEGEKFQAIYDRLENRRGRSRFSLKFNVRCRTMRNYHESNRGSLEIVAKDEWSNRGWTSRVRDHRPGLHRFRLRALCPPEVDIFMS